MNTTTLRARLGAIKPPRRVELSVESLLLVSSAFWLLASNRLFLKAALQGREWADPSAWGFGLALMLAVVALHVLLLAPLANRWTTKPLLALLFIATAFATYFMEHYGIFLDPSMLRNVLHTDVHEAGELFSLSAWPSMLPHLLLVAGPPLWLLTRVDIRRRALGPAFVVRLAFMATALVVMAAALLSVYQPLSSLTRQHKEVRYLVTPANWLWSTGAVLAAEVRGAAKPRRAIGLDAKPGPMAAARLRPSVLVLVVGETARAANWSLSGYARQTTPRLATLPVLNFPDVTSCGTNTETSVPCLFAPVGRRQYDEATIRGSESLLHVLARAGVAVQWRDNQSGCKGVCEGLPSETVAQSAAPGLCSNGHCLDEGLLQGLESRLKDAKGPQVLVLHMLGNHGPSYFRRYPPAFAKFQPACAKDDLRQCTREEIVNAYDNALLYTDELLARLVETLRASAADTAMVYVSDHGESLGEKGLYLHGVPYAIAPREQTHVPMLMWASEGWRASMGLDVACLQQRAAQPAAHDHFFHTVLGLMDVRTALYEPAFDLTAGCRKQP